MIRQHLQCAHAGHMQLQMLDQIICAHACARPHRHALVRWGWLRYSILHSYQALRQLPGLLHSSLASVYLPSGWDWLVFWVAWCISFIVVTLFLVPVCILESHEIATLEP